MASETNEFVSRIKTWLESVKIAEVLPKMKRYSYEFQKLVIRNREIKAVIVWLIFVTGSFIADFFPLPGSYFSNRQNIFNVYFVKKGWGWTCGLLFSYITTMLISYNVYDKGRILKHLGRLVMATVTWFLLTSLFEIVEHLTGVCLDDSLANSKSACIRRGSIWDAFDISGHAFLLSFCILIINEELQGIAHWRRWVQEKECSSPRDGAVNEDLDGNKTKLFPEIKVNDILVISVDILSVLLTALMVLWEFMLFCTCVYFHTIYQKLSGILFGVGSWYCLYHIVFQLDNQFSPCFPIQSRTSCKLM